MELGREEHPHKIEKSLVERSLSLMVLCELKWVTQVKKPTKAAKNRVAQI